MKKLTLKLKLLEDLHTGSGIGSMLIDNNTQKDRFGNPRISRRHLKGLWRDSALFIAEQTIKAQERAGVTYDNMVTEDVVMQLFGKPSQDVGKHLNFSSAYLINPEQFETLIWASSAREEGALTSKQGSLRSLEYVPAGAIFAIDMWLRKEELLPQLQDIVYATSHYGSRRNRGSGRVVAELAPLPAKAPVTKKNSENPLDNWCQLLIRAEDRVTLSDTTQPENIIPTQTHISTSTLQGALLAQTQYLNFPELSDAIAGNCIRVGNGYPVPFEKLDGTPKKAIPCPLHFHAPKHDQRIQTRVNTFNILNNTQNDNKSSQQKLKKPSEHLYLIYDDEGWQEYVPEVYRDLHIQTPSQKNVQSRNNEQSLFTIESLAEKTHFITEIFVPAEFSTDWKKFLNELRNQCLDIGKGKAPCTVTDIYMQGIAFANSLNDKSKPPTIEVGEQRTLNLSLTSDLVTYDDWLRPHQSLTLAAIKQSIAPSHSTLHKLLDSNQITYSYYSLPAVLHSFNAPAGFPNRAIPAIRRGSSFSLQGPKELIDKIENELKKLPFLGNGQIPGTGNFLLNITLDNVSETQDSEPNSEANINEELLFYAMQFVTSKQGPSRSQWLDFWNRCEACKFQSTWSKNGYGLLQEVLMWLIKQSAKNSGRAWGSVAIKDIQAVLTNMETIGSFPVESAIRFLDFWVQCHLTDINQLKGDMQ